MEQNALMVLTATDAGADQDTSGKTVRLRLMNARANPVPTEEFVSMLLLVTNVTAQEDITDLVANLM